MQEQKYRKSSYCTDAHGCVEVAINEKTIRVRDAKVADGVPLEFTRAEWNAFVSGVKNGEFDLVD